MFFLLLISCNGKKGREDVAKEYELINPLTGTYINLKSTSGVKYTMPFTNLTYVTKYNILDYAEGNTERVQILLGQKQLPDEKFQFIDKLPRVSIYMVDSLSPDSVLKKKLYQALRDDGYFAMPDDTTDAELIYYATEMGYSIGFYEGSFHWRYEIPLKELVTEIKCK